MNKANESMRPCRKCRAVTLLGAREVYCTSCKEAREALKEKDSDKRERAKIAAMMAQGILSGGGSDWTVVAESAVKLADALLLELERTEKP